MKKYSRGAIVDNVITPVKGDNKYLNSPCAQETFCCKGLMVRCLEGPVAFCVDFGDCAWTFGVCH